MTGPFFTPWAVWILPVVFGAAVLATACTSSSDPQLAASREAQQQLDGMWAESDWIGVIALLEGLEKQRLLAPQHRESLYAAYIAGAKPLVDEGRFRDARSFLDRAVQLSPSRPEANDVLETRERELRAFLRDPSGGAQAAAPWYQHVEEVIILGDEAAVRTDLRAGESGRSIARALCDATLTHSRAGLEAVSVIGMNGWTAARC